MATIQQIEKAVSILTKGGIVVFPTDTVWGIGCRLDNLPSIKKLYEIRRRPRSQAVPILVSSFDQAKEYFQKLPSDVDNLIEKYWPGGLTVVFNAVTEKIPALARANNDTVGLRMPNHHDLLKIIELSKTPILGPSANFHNFPTPEKFSDLDPMLLKLADYVLPGECLENKSSTIVDVTEKPWKIIRQGAVKVVI